MRDAYGRLTVLLAFVAVLSSNDGFIGDVTDRPKGMLNRLAIVSMKDSWEICIIPNSQSLLIQMPSSCFGSPRSCI